MPPNPADSPDDGEKKKASGKSPPPDESMLGSEHDKKVESWHQKHAADYRDTRYGRRSVTQFSYLIRRDIACRMMQDVTGKILDIGCGPGPFVEHMAADNRTLFTVDIAAGMVQEARRHAAEKSIELQGFASNLARLGIQDSVFDGVICIGVMGYIGNPMDALRELYRVMKPGAMAVIQVSNPNSIKEILYQRYVPAIKRMLGRQPAAGYGWNFELKSYTRRQFNRMLRIAGFQILDWSYYDFHIPFLERVNNEAAIAAAENLQPLGKNRAAFWLAGAYLAKLRKPQRTKSEAHNSKD